MRRVLVTGSAGFIGRWVCHALAARGIEPIPFDKPETVLDCGHLYAATSTADGVINLAGVLGTPETFGAERYAADVNILGAINVFDVAAARRIPVVQIGTGHKGQPNPYAITKGAAEDLALARARYCGERIAVVRAFHVYGEGQIPCAPHGPAKVRKIVPSFICRALTGMDIMVNGDGQQLIDLVYVEDVASVLVDALTARPGALLHAGTGKPSTVAQVARTVLTATGSVSRTVTGADRPGEPAGSVVVADAPECPNPWPHRLAETVEWYRTLLQ